MKGTDAFKETIKTYIESHDVDITKDKFTISQFIELTIDSYNGQIINQLKESYERD